MQVLRERTDKQDVLKGVFSEWKQQKSKGKETQELRACFASLIKNVTELNFVSFDHQQLIWCVIAVRLGGEVGKGD